MKPYTIEQQMDRFGIPTTEQGPFVTELRGMVARKLRNGMIYMSAGTHAPDFYDLSYEEQAKVRLAFEWSTDHNHGYRVKVMDPLWGWRIDVSTMERSFYFRWWRVPAWLGDRRRELACKCRVFWHRRVLRLQNPYT